jgi:hypothetical protein
MLLDALFDKYQLIAHCLFFLRGRSLTSNPKTGLKAGQVDLNGWVKSSLWGTKPPNGIY